jgi:carbohydrate-selective porin OprB
MSSVGKAWGDMLKAYGIYINGGFEEEVTGVPSGGRKQGAWFNGEYTIGVDLDLKQILGIPGAAIHVSTDDRTGPNPFNFSGTGQSDHANYGPNDAYRLAELSWDQDLFNDHVRILVGRIADNIDFDTSELYCQFIMMTCGNTNAWYFNNSNPSYPVANWGGRITIKPTLSTYFRTGAYQETNNQGLPSEQGWFDNRWGFSNDTGVFVPFEAGYKTNFDNDAYPRGYDVGGYWDTSYFGDPLLNSAGLNMNFANPAGTPLMRKDRTGVYVQGQQMVYRVDSTTQRGLTVFGAGLWDTSGGGPVNHMVVLGLWDKGPLPTRPADSLGFTVNWWNFNTRTVQAVADTICLAQYSTGFCAGSNPRWWKDEYQMELNYGFELAPGIEFKPYVDYWIHPDLRGYAPYPTHASNPWAIGAQLSLSPNGAFGLPAFVRTN